MLHGPVDHLPTTIRSALARQVFGPGSSVAWERMAEGVSTRVYRLTRGDERFYLRILPEPDTTFAPEVRVHQLARELGCRVPDVLHYEARNELLGCSVMLTTEIPGEPVTAYTDPETAGEIVRAAGRDLARINTIPVDGFGWIKRDGTAVPERLASEHASFDALIEADYIPALDVLPSDAVDGIERARLEKAAGQAIRLVGDASEARLAHGDFDTTHIFATNGAYTGIIDFGEIRGMPCYYDLGHHRMHDRERLPYSTLGWLLEGYREITSLPDDIEESLSALSVFIAMRALVRGLQHSPDSRIVRTAHQSILTEVALLERLAD